MNAAPTLTIESRPVCGKYVEVTIKCDNSTFNTGLLDEAQRNDLVAELRRAADDIEGWRLH